MTTKDIVSDSGKKYTIPVMSADEMHDVMFGSIGGRGWCLTCGEEVDGVEPDARRYLCEACDNKTVYGYEELLIMDLLIIK
jgi:Zn finger protein HypA/HybF involved in hydrogenase expression